MKIDYENAITILRDIYWVGFEERDTNLHCNSYILIDDNEAVFFDTGSIPDFPTIMRKVLEVVDFKTVSLIVASHQDPDVCGNMVIVEDVVDNPDLKIAAHSNTARLIRHYGLKSDIYVVDNHNYKITLKSGRELEFIYAPFLHSPGAIVTYDKKTKTLFSGDLFGGVSKEWSLFEDDNLLQNMKAFHQLYMPSSKILTSFLNKLDSYEIERILPQHGSVIEGDSVKKAIEFLKSVPCGIDLIEK
ncbi:MAG: MBL fold metallo-hydrolase [Sulfurimonas sp.]|nr:MBL fold metallo-hydrolase [Sulfurimonas sp.]